MKSSTAVAPIPSTVSLPLMTGPIVSAEDEHEKKKHYLLEEVEEKLKDLHEDEMYELRKTRLFLFCLLCSIAAVLLILFAMGLTVLFQSDKPKGTVAIMAWAFGSCLLIPFVIWFKILFLPNEEEADRRKKMHQKRRARVDEQARVRKENLRLARIEDEKREAAKKEMLEAMNEEENNRRSSSGNRKSSSRY